jgi:hypothetical protein
MKPGKNDKQYKILITGQELEELKKFTGDMVEAFGLDNRIEKYQGKRPIGFYPWDLDCLEAVLYMAVDDTREYPDKSVPGYEAITKLYARIVELHKMAYE